MRTAVQLYSFRAVDVSTPELFERIADAGFEGVEFAGLPNDIDPRTVLDEAGLVAASAHVPYDDLDENLEGVAAEYEPLTSALVVPYMSPERFETAEKVDDVSLDLDALDNRLPERVSLAYHNHEFELRPFDGGSTGFDRLLAESDVSLELDVGWAHAADADPIGLIDRYADRIDRLHLKDVVVDAGAERGGRPVPLGAGDVDLIGCVDAAERADVEWLIVEHDDPNDPLAMLDDAGEALRSFLESADR